MGQIACKVVALDHFLARISFKTLIGNFADTGVKAVRLEAAASKQGAPNIESNRL